MRSGTKFKVLVWKCLLFVLLISPSAIIRAQDQPVRNPSMVLKISPQHFFVNGLHLELEKSLRPGSKHSIIFSPHIYAGSTRSTDNFVGRDYYANAGEMIGYGLELGHRIYAKPDKAFEGFYMSYGLNYHHFQIDYEDYGWFNFQGENGLEYFNYDYGTITETINRYGGSTVFGYQHSVFTDRLLVDLYIGGGFKYSDRKSTSAGIRYNQGAQDYGFSGTHFLAGFKVGLVL